MSKHVFKSAVIHDGKTFITGDLCPDSLHAEMLKKGLVSPVVEVGKSGEPLKSSDAELKAAAELKAKAEAAKVESEAKAKAEADAKNKK